MDGNLEAPVATAQPQGCAADAAPEDHATAPISRIVAEVVGRCPGERISLGEMAEAFGDRAFGLLILLLLLPSLLPGMASVFGTPVLILGVQMGLGRRVPKLPAFLARQSVKREDLLRLTGNSSKWLNRIERYVKPRPGFFATPLSDRIFGWLTAYVAIMLILPGPGTNGPPAFGNIIMALGLVEHDSRVTGIGMAVTFLGCAFATAILAALGWGLVAAFDWMF